jgi:hypothetical protein
MKLAHLAKRALTSLWNGPVGQSGLETARSVLNDGEMELWASMQPRDQRHSLVVLRRFGALVPAASRAERAAALLHDVGKVPSNLGWTARILATIVGPRGRRFGSYARHESVGAAMLASVSEERTVELVAMLVDDAVSRAIASADDV